MKYLFVACVILFFSCKGDQTKQAELELEKAKLELELEKTKLERERLRGSENTKTVSAKEEVSSEGIQEEMGTKADEENIASTTVEQESKPPKAQTYPSDPRRRAGGSLSNTHNEPEKPAPEADNILDKWAKDIDDKKKIIIRGAPELRRDIYISMVDDAKLRSWLQLDEAGSTFRVSTFYGSGIDPTDFTTMDEYVFTVGQEYSGKLWTGSYDVMRDIKIQSATEVTDYGTYTIYRGQDYDWRIMEQDPRMSDVDQRVFNLESHNYYAPFKALALHLTRGFHRGYHDASSTEQRVRFERVLKRNYVD